MDEEVYLSYKGCLGTIKEDKETGRYSGCLMYTPTNLVYESDTLSELRFKFREVAKYHLKSLEDPTSKVKYLHKVKM